MIIVAAAYVGSFGLAGLVCLGALRRTREIEDDAVRYGLVGLLATTALWALLKALFFLLPEPFREPTYTVGLVFGFATVWAWLYFCSAYTGREYHRNRTLRLISVGLFAAVVLVKLTNPLHGLYFTTSEATTPFHHLAIEHGLFHWTVTGLSYVLAGIGLFMVFELYLDSEYDTRQMTGLTALLGLPLLLDLSAYLTPWIVDVIYAPLGVAAFALGVLYVYERRFLAIQATEEDDAVVFLDGQGNIRDYSSTANTVFPDLTGSVGDPLSDVLPAVATLLDSEQQVLAHERDGETRYYLVSNNTVELGNSVGRVVLFSDVTQAEKRRRELARHNEQLEGFASALTHELRNVLQIIDWRLASAAERIDPDTVEYEAVETASEANDRLSGLVDDFTQLTRYGQTVDRLDTVEFERAVRDAWRNVETDDVQLNVENDGTLEADPNRLRELFRNAFSFARLNGATSVTVSLRADGFSVTDDGEPPSYDIERYFSFGESVPSAESGMKLPNVQTFARVHGWSIDIDTGYQDGIRLRVSKVTTTVAGEEKRAAGEVNTPG
jgi:signal transduction histidine kinase